MMDIKRANGDIGYKAHMRRAVIKGKKSAKGLEAISVVKHKKEATLDSEKVTVGKGIHDYVFTTFFETDADIQQHLKNYAAYHENNNSP